MSYPCKTPYPYGAGKTGQPKTAHSGLELYYSNCMTHRVTLIVYKGAWKSQAYNHATLEFVCGQYKPI